jgi:hypothetical protein
MPCPRHRKCLSSPNPIRMRQKNATKKKEPVKHRPFIVSRELNDQAKFFSAKSQFTKDVR